MVLKLDLPPYVDIGAIVVPLTLSKRRLIVQTGIDMVCGPDGELCVCYHNGHALLNEDEISTYDGDFFVCWLDDETPQAAGIEAVSSLAASAVSEWIVTVEVNCSHALDTTDDNRQ